MRKYKVGDKLRIRKWNDMEAEFGSVLGNIPIGGIYFVSHMKHLCELDFTVSGTSERRGHCFYHSEEGVENGWNIIAEMLEPRIEEELYIATDSELDELLYGGESI